VGVGREGHVPETARHIFRRKGVKKELRDSKFCGEKGNRKTQDFSRT